jgi:aspartate oxidase
VRSAASLQRAQAVVDDTRGALSQSRPSAAAGELGNLVQLADALLASAQTRTESRGAHSRLEFPDTEPVWRRRLLHGRAGVGR